MTGRLLFRVASTKSWRLGRPEHLRIYRFTAAQHSLGVLGVHRSSWHYFTLFCFVRCCLGLAFSLCWRYLLGCYRVLHNDSHRLKPGQVDVVTYQKYRSQLPGLALPTSANQSMIRACFVSRQPRRSSGRSLSSRTARAERPRTGDLMTPCR